MSDRPDIWIMALRPEDIDSASAIESMSMPRPWPRAELLRDLLENPGATYLGAHAAPLRGSAVRDADGVGILVGFVGSWLLVDELHVTTIAVHPDWRRLGIGRSLLLHLIRAALGRGATAITLEVRASNGPAQRLYEGLGFRLVGRRRGYYSDNGEDALIMTTPPATDVGWLIGLDALERRAYAYWERRAG